MSFYLDTVELEKFKVILPPAASHEAYCVALAIRPKYLGIDERLSLQISKTTMAGMTIVRDGDWHGAIAKAYSCLQYMVTRNGSPVPAKAVVCYGSINPKSLLKAYNSFSATIAEKIADAIVMGSGDLSFLARIDKELNSAIAKSPGKRTFLDIDMDVHDIGRYKGFLEDLKKHNIHHHIIRTQGGYHLLIDTKTVRKTGYRLQDNIAELRKIAEPYEERIELPSNDIVPVPGTMQNETVVQLIDI